MTIMTTDKVELLTDKIFFIEKKIARIEELLLLLVEEEYLSEDEKLRIAKTDEIIKNKDLEKLIMVE